MPSIDELREAILLVAPGFLALKLFYLFGVQRPRSEWEWTTWSLVVTLPLAAAAAYFSGWVASTVGADPATTEDVLRFVIAVLTGVGLAGLWFVIRHSRLSLIRTLRDAVTDSSYDATFDEAYAYDRPLTVAMKDGSFYRGRLRFGGREDTGAEGWLYLRFPRQLDHGRWRPSSKKDHGILLPKSDVKWAHFFMADGDPDLPNGE